MFRAIRAVQSLVGRDRWIARLVVAVCLLALPAASARAQGDGPRTYQIVPAGTRVVSVYGLFTRGKQSVDPGSVIEGGDIAVDVAVVQYVHPVTLGNRVGGVFAVLPLGEVTGTLRIPGNDFSGSSSWIGDMQLGWVQNIVGPPPLTGKDFATWKPGFTFGLLGKLTTPTGAYSSDNVINLGANRWAFQLGTPITWYLGRSFVDPKLTTFELLPSVTFYTRNGDPNGADTLEQKPILRIEGHITRNLNQALWLSLDATSVHGGETTTDGIEGGNPQRALMLGGSANLTFSRSTSLKVSYGEVVSRNDDGPDGHMFRVIGTVVF